MSTSSSPSISPASSAYSTPAPASPAPSTTSSSRSFWPRDLIYASPHPSTLSGGRQLDTAPMCPCNACWEYGSHTLAPPKPPKTPKAPKAAKDHKDHKFRSPLHFLKKSNASLESVASDMRPLHPSTTLASSASSVYTYSAEK